MDELRRLRELAEDAPGPDPQRKAQARSELLQLAQEEASAREEARARDAAPASVDRGVGWLEALRRYWLRPAPAIGLAAAAVIAVAGVGVLLSEPGTEPPAQLAESDTSADTGAGEAEDGDPGPGEAEPGAVEPDPEPTPEDAAIELAASCTDPEGGITVAYPDDWFTPEEGEPGACRFFGEEAFDVDVAIGGQPVADLEVRVQPEALDTLRSDDIGLDESERERLELDERTVVRQRLATTGEGALPEGVWVERYLIDLGDETAILTVQDEDETVLDERRTLLEEMVRSLRVDDAP